MSVGDALIGLLGVLVGGLISVGAQWRLAGKASSEKQRADSRAAEGKVRAAVRVVQEELVHLRLSLELLSVATMPGADETPDLSTLTTRQWPSKAASLAALTPAEDWFPLSRAYLCI